MTIFITEPIFASRQRELRLMNRELQLRFDKGILEPYRSRCRQAFRLGEALFTWFERNSADSKNVLSETCQALDVADSISALTKAPTSPIPDFEKQLDGLRAAILRRWDQNIMEMFTAGFALEHLKIASKKVGRITHPYERGELESAQGHTIMAMQGCLVDHDLIEMVKSIFSKFEAETITYEYALSFFTLLCELLSTIGINEEPRTKLEQFAMEAV